MTFDRWRASGEGVVLADSPPGRHVLPKNVEAAGRPGWRPSRGGAGAVV